MQRRIALISYTLPAPANSGSRLRTVRLASSLANLGPVTVYCRTVENELESLSGHEDLRPFVEVRSVTYPAAEYAKITRLFTPAAVVHWTAERDPLAVLLADDHRRDPFDVVVCAQCFTVNAAAGAAAVPVVLDEHNIESSAARCAVAASNSKGGPKLEDCSAAVLRHEQAAWRRASLVTCVTEADARHVRECSGRPAEVVANGVDFDQLRFIPPSGRAGEEILFVGAYFWPPNARAARFLAREVLPRVRAARSSARLTLCGKNPGVDVVLLRRPEVEVTDTVASVAPYLDRAAVFANALFEGAGSSLKCLEALTCGVPLVSTLHGVRGFPLTAGKQFLAAETADEFASAILAVLAAPERYDEMARLGQAVAREFAWKRTAARFAELVSEVAARGSVTGS